MATLTIRKLDERLKARLRIRAARHGRSMEEEARVILKSGLDRQEPPPGNPAAAIREIFEPLGGVELELPSRGPGREPPVFSE
ncbi:MAG: hypothetical protein KJZ84_21750 [Bryobacteraceae bacterium]|nr:hypothetical protein [Bryobacteraceae bacterium]MCL4797206.1 hypothetical protein [Bryobacteraceae bacterium]